MTSEIVTATEHTGETIQVVVFELDGRSYALPVDRVRSVESGLSVSPVPGSPAHIVGVSNLRGKIIGVVDTRHILGLETGARSDQIMVLALGARTLGIQVDRVSDVSTIHTEDIQPAPPTLSDSGTVVGISRMRDELLIHVDPDAFARTNHDRNAP